MSKPAGEDEKESLTCMVGCAWVLFALAGGASAYRAAMLGPAWLQAIAPIAAVVGAMAATWLPRITPGLRGTLKRLKEISAAEKKAGDGE